MYFDGHWNLGIEEVAAPGPTGLARERRQVIRGRSLVLRRAVAKPDKRVGRLAGRLRAVEIEVVLHPGVGIGVIVFYTGEPLQEHAVQHGTGFIVEASYPPEPFPIDRVV